MENVIFYVRKLYTMWCQSGRILFYGSDLQAAEDGGEAKAGGGDEGPAAPAAGEY